MPSPLTSPAPATPSFPDSLLVERARARDAKAFAELACPHEHKLRRVVSRMVPVPSDQDEVLQDALLAAWRHLPAFEGRSQFGSWLYRVTTNAALMRLRQQGHRPDTAVGNINELAQAQSSQGGQAVCGASSCWIERPDEAMQRTELRVLLQRKVAELPPVLREIFLLRHVEGLSTKETAEVLAVTEATVRARLHRACLALRKAIHRSAVDVDICRGHQGGARRDEGAAP